MKLCNKCLEAKSDSEFYPGRAKCKSCVLEEQVLYRDNKREYYRSYSRNWRLKNKELSRKYESERYKKRVKKMNDSLSEYFPERECRVCGYNRCFAAIDYHHLNPRVKSFSPKMFIHKMKNMSKISEKSLTTLRDELKKCIPLCSNCHREYHSGMIVLDHFVSES